MSDGRILQKGRQIEILNILIGRPYELFYGPEITEIFPMNVLCANLKYLHDCGYVDARLSANNRGELSFGGASITSKGVSYFEENGGLYKEAATQTIEIDQSSFRKMLEDYVEASSKDKTIKARLRAAIKNAPAEGLKTLAGSLLHSGLQAAPDAWQLLEATLLH